MSQPDRNKLPVAWPELGVSPGAASSTNHRAVGRRPVQVLLRRWADTPAIRVVVLVASVHALVTAAVVLGAQVVFLGEGVVGRSFGVDPRSLPGAWLRYDSSYYLSIARQGYAAAGAELGFMPVYPLLVRAAGLTTDADVLAWVGLLVSNVAFCGAAACLWHIVRHDHGNDAAWNTVITLTLFPTGLFFAAFYTESVFLLWSVLTYWAARRGWYAGAGALVAIASLTRINGLGLVVIPLAELLLRRPARWGRTCVLTAAISGLGLGVYGAYLLFQYGSPVAFVTAQQTSMLRTVALPWTTVTDTARVILGLDGFADNRFMRWVSVYDLAATLLLAACAAASCRLLRSSLAVYLVAALVALTVSHGPYTLGLYSMSRYVLALFPGFIVMGIILDHWPRLKVGAWGASLAALLAASAWFGAGRWVA